MALSLQTFQQWTQQQAAAVQAAAAGLVNFVTGSVELAVTEANTTVALWMQWLVLRVLALTRAATSVGADLDSWMADFTLPRLAAVFATGQVTFSRFTTGQTALIIPFVNADGSTNSAGAQVKTADGTQTFSVTTDTANAAWSPSQGGYAVGSSTASVTVPVVAVNAGTQGNVVADAISQVSGTAIPGIDMATNAVAFTNGLDAERDAAYRTRFANYINTRSRATTAAVAYAISSVQQGLTWTIAENQNVDGSFAAGRFVVTVDDGSGAPSGALLALVTAAVDAVRPIGSIFTVQAPSVVTANATLTIAVAAGYVKANLLAPVIAAYDAFVSALPMGAPLPWSRVAQIAYDVSPGITNVTAVLVNGATDDVGGGSAQVVRPGTCVVS